jgi:hypothetical protein
MAGTIALIEMLLLTKFSCFVFVCVYGFLPIFAFANFITGIWDVE